MRKKLLTAITSCALLLTISACGNTAKENTTLSTTQNEEIKENSMQNKNDKSLVAYFSWSGNTEHVAKEIQKQTNSDIFKITPKTPYTSDYDDLLTIAQEEQKTDARPEMANKIENIKDYDTVYLGFPNWYYDMPMILYSFLDEVDLAGKKIVPFVTSGGSGFSDAITTIKSMEPDGDVLEGLAIGEANASTASSDITEWLEKLGLLN